MKNIISSSGAPPDHSQTEIDTYLLNRQSEANEPEDGINNYTNTNTRQSQGNTG